MINEIRNCSVCNCFVSVQNNDRNGTRQIGDSLRVVIRTTDVQTARIKCGLQVVKQPIASSKSANKENGLIIYL